MMKITNYQMECEILRTKEFRDYSKRIMILF